MKKKNAISVKAARLLRKVVKHILAEPLRYDQDEVLKFPEPGDEFWYTAIGCHKVPACGTIGCLAGWVTTLEAKNPKKVSDPIAFAARKLGLTYLQRGSLFGGVYSWPDKFTTAYYDAKTPEAVAQVASDRVEHFIKTGE